jgi:hypothetical protein
VTPLGRVIPSLHPLSSAQTCRGSLVTNSKPNQSGECAVPICLTPFSGEKRRAPPLLSPRQRNPNHRHQDQRLSRWPCPRTIADKRRSPQRGGGQRSGTEAAENDLERSSQSGREGGGGAAGAGAGVVTGQQRGEGQATGRGVAVMTENAVGGGVTRDTSPNASIRGAISRRSKAAFRLFIGGRAREGGTLWSLAIALFLPA